MPADDEAGVSGGFRGLLHGYGGRKVIAKLGIPARCPPVGSPSGGFLDD